MLAATTVLVVIALHAHLQAAHLVHGNVPRDSDSTTVDQSIAGCADATRRALRPRHDHLWCNKQRCKQEYWSCRSTLEMHPWDVCCSELQCWFGLSIRTYFYRERCAKQPPVGFNPAHSTLLLIFTPYIHVCKKGKDMDIRAAALCFLALLYSVDSQTPVPARPLGKPQDVC